MVFRSFLPSLDASLFGPKAISPLSSLQTEIGREMARMVDDALRGVATSAYAPTAAMALRLDVKEDDKAFTVTTDLPGLTEKDVDITFENDLLTIRGEKKSDYDQTIGTWHLVERTSGSFARQLSLPVTIDEEKIEAHFTNGVLTIILPKKPIEETKTKKISIKTS